MKHIIMDHDIFMGGTNPLSPPKWRAPGQQPQPSKVDANQTIGSMYEGSHSIPEC